MTNTVTTDRIHFEDIQLGTVISLGKTRLSKEMIIGFAREFDPLPFHVDEKAAKASLLGGLAASGWQTAGISLRMLVDAFLSRAASLGGLGFSDLKWKRPVMVGDTISGTVTISDLRRSESHAHWGIVTFDLDIRNQRDQNVMSMRLANLIEVREPGASMPEPAAGETAL